MVRRTQTDEATGGRRGEDYDRGMTLVEMMIVITLIAAIMGIVALNVANISDDAKIDLAEAEIEKLEGNLDTYYLQKEPHRYPESLTELAEGSSAIIEDAAKLNDPWGNRYWMERTSRTEITVLSAGPDGTRGTVDDVGRSK